MWQETFERKVTECKKYEKLLWLDSITCIVDAEAVFTHGDNADLSALKIRQIAIAELVVGTLILVVRTASRAM